MAAEKDNAVLSDTEGGEKYAREQLKKAHIQDANASKATTDVLGPAVEMTTDNGEATAESAEGRGRLQKKRSYEEVEDENAQESTATPARQHTRKRSRDSAVEEDALNNGVRKSLETDRDKAAAGADTEANGNAKPPRLGTPEQTTDARNEAAVESLTSPKTKRSRLHSTTDEEAATSASEAQETPSAKKEETSIKLPPGSAFANTSSASPFGALAGRKSPSTEPQTSASAFTSSGFGALAASPPSGFGALAKTTGGPGLGSGFASGGKSPLSTKGNDAPAPASAFGSTLGQKSAFSTAGGSSSGFGSGTSGFSTLGSSGGGSFSSTLGSGLGGSGFGSLAGGGLSSFASGKAAAPFGSSVKGAKPFGAAADDDEGEDDNEDDDDKSGMRSPLSGHDEKQDERFYEQSLETGEEGELTEFSCRSKLYNWASVEGGKKEWRERGIGVLKLNVRKPGPDDEDEKLTARLLIRADGSHRIVLNTPVKKEIKFGDPRGDKPQGGYLFFSGTIDDKPDLMLLQLKASILSRGNTAVKHMGTRALTWIPGQANQCARTI